MEYLILAVALTILILFFFGKSYYDVQCAKKRFRETLKNSYGSMPKREYKPEDMRSIPKYFQKHQDDRALDDITWYDLDLDDVFKRMNYTHSSVGEEYLYYMLRNPVEREDELLHREHVIRYFNENEEERVACQFIFAGLGHLGRFSVYDYIDYLDLLGERKNWKHYLSFAMLAFGIMVMLVSFSVGLLLLLGVLIYNYFSYFREKKEIEPYITSFSYIFRLMDTCEKLKARKISNLEEEFQKMEPAYTSLCAIRRGSYILMTSGRFTGNGSPVDLFMDFVRMGFHIDLIKFNQMLRTVRNHLEDIDCLLTQLGFIEACISIGEYRKSIENYCIPVFQTKKAIKAAGIYHPLLTDPVGNSFATEHSMLITGSNASGKSTFLKTVAINAILAQSIHTCLAKSYESCFFRIYSSMSLKDNVFHGESYYMVEIKAIKRILDQITKGKGTVLCFVDEVLRGTNTVERIAASSQIMRQLNQQNSLCFVATHDIELTHLLGKEYDNYHFKEEVLENDITFSYHLMKGCATTRNAIRLLSIMGFQDEIVQKAENMAEEFMKTNTWQMLDYDFVQ